MKGALDPREVAQPRKLDANLTMFMVSQGNLTEECQHLIQRRQLQNRAPIEKQTLT